MKLGIDIGGTFTDLVLWNEDGQSTHIVKTLTTYPDPIEGILTGVREVVQTAGIEPNQIKTIVHGTTLITNAVIERKGSKTGLLTTSGFEDLLEIGRELRYDIYDLFIDMPEPLIARPYRIGIKERMDKEGKPIITISKNDVIAATGLLVEAGIESIAICYLHSYANARHEQWSKQWIKEIYPDLYVSISSDIIPEVREYERLSTTAMNAYVQAIAEKYLLALRTSLKEIGVTAQLYIMLSNGTVTAIEKAIEKPVLLLESGPAGGVAIAQLHAKSLDVKYLMAFDMGGTTAKASTIVHGIPEITQFFEAGRVKRFRKGSGLPVKMPVLDLIEIGAGGGSIAWINTLGLLEVGPESTASNPGPACYGLGGIYPTVTDAALVLGHLDPRYFAGGKMPLYPQKSRDAIFHYIAKPLGISIEEAAIGIQRVVTENMANAARVHTIEKGLDPTRFTLLAFGGAGPLHAFQVGRLLHIETFIIPPAAGVSSSAGFLVSPFSESRAFSYICAFQDINWSYLSHKFEEITIASINFIKKNGPPGPISVKRYVDMRYAGQGWEVTVQLPDDPFTQQSIPMIEKSFDQVYGRLYGRILSHMPKETITWRVECSIVNNDNPKLQHGNKDVSGRSLKGYRMAFMDGDAVPVSCPVYNRYFIPQGQVIQGPALIEENESTTVIGYDGTFTVGLDGSIITSIKKHSYVT